MNIIDEIVGKCIPNALKVDINYFLDDLNSFPFMILAPNGVIDAYRPYKIHQFEPCVFLCHHIGIYRDKIFPMTEKYEPNKNLYSDMKVYSLIQHKKEIEQRLIELNIEFKMAKIKLKKDKINKDFYDTDKGWA